MELKDIKELVRFFDKSGLTELELDNGDNRVYMSKMTASQQAPMQAVYAPVPAAAPQPVREESPKSEKTDKGKTIVSPMIGTYYSAPSPGAAPFVKTGDIVEKGQTLCIIEAMKIMNTIEADFRCKIVSILTENGKPVEYGQDIFVVEPQ